MNARPIHGTEVVTSEEGFARFYREHLPTVYGYALRLCGGDAPAAEELTQDAWTALVRELVRGRTECADVRWIVTVARSRFIDRARRERRADAKMALLRPELAADQESDTDPTRAEVLALLDRVQPLHRAVLMMRYIDGLPVSEIAEQIGRDRTATHSLLARARTELRRHGRRSGHD